MRVALATTGLFPHAVGGMQRHSYFLARHLAALGVDALLLHPAHQQGVVEADGPIRARAVPWPSLRGPYHYMLEYYLYSIGIARVLAAEPDLEVAFGQGYSLWAYLRGARLPCVFHPHGLEQFQAAHWRDRLALYPWRPVARHHVRHSARVVSLGGKLTQILIDHCGARPDRVAVIPNAVSLEYVDRLLPRRSEPSRTLLFVGRLAPHKGLQLLRAAMRELGAADWRLDVVGEGPLRGRLERTGDGRMRFLGRLPDRDLFQAYGRSWGLVFPGRGEGMPTVLLEAMAAGLPVIGTDVGAVRDVITPEVGFLVPPGDRSALAEAMRALLGLSAEERDRMGRAARARVEALFSWPAIARATLDLLEETASSHAH